jgi:hypothetical protein
LVDNVERINIDRYIGKRSLLRRTHKMETWYYEVVSIDGDYANLKRTDIESDDLKLVARALLPYEIKEGDKLKYEFMQYELI